MNKEKVKKAIKVLTCSLCRKCYFPKRRSCKNCLDQNRRMIKRYIKQLEQKETISDKVTDRLKEIKKELEDDGYDYYAKEITKTLNMIEGDEK